MEKQSRQEEWRQRMDSFGREGLSIREWCERHGVTEQRFYYWRRRLAASGNEQREKTGWCALEVVSERARAIGDCGISIYIGGARIELKTEFDPAALRAVVRALEAA